MGEKNGGRANLIKQRRYDLVPGIQKVYKKNMYTLCTPGCTSLYPLSFNTKYVHPLYAQKGRECKLLFVIGGSGADAVALTHRNDFFA